jgi:hypothetical protein
LSVFAGDGIPVFPLSFDAGVYQLAIMSLEQDSLIIKWEQLKQQGNVRSERGLK